MPRCWFRNLGLVVLACVPEGTPARSAPVVPEAAGAVNRGVAYLRNQFQGAGGVQVGETALAALALSKAGIPANDPVLLGMIDRILRRFNGSIYVNERTGGAETYEAAVVIMALASVAPEQYVGEIKAAANFLVGRQKANGAWDYSARIGDTGDTSISQYALLGLWEAENAGAPVAPQVWERAARWLLRTQDDQGAWAYHRDEGGADTVSMTAAGVGSLLICDRQLAPHRKGAEGLSKLLTPLAEQAQYPVTLSSAQIRPAIQRGITWIARNFRPGNTKIMGNSTYYGLYGIERVGALTGQQRLRNVDWFGAGLQYILQTQQQNGSWLAQEYRDIPNTCWAILFMTKATAISVEKIRIRRLGAGTLLGGRGLPKDLSNVTIAQGRITVRPMNGAVDAMLAVMDDPRAENAEGALAGLMRAYDEQGPKALRPHKDHFRKLLTNPDQGVRALAAWALGRTGDLDVVPSLIGALQDPDEGVVTAARISLQLLSRKVDGLGPPTPSTPEQRAESAARWRAWFNSVRPPELSGQDDLTRSPLHGPIPPEGEGAHP